jgi:hypothetical protein
VPDLVRGLHQENRRMKEEHIAYILKEVVKVGVLYSHVYFKCMPLDCN